MTSNSARDEVPSQGSSQGQITCDRSEPTGGALLGATGTTKDFNETIAVIGCGIGMSPLLANVAMVDSFHGTISSGDEPSTESRMCTEESAERMTSSTEGMVSLSEDSSGRDTYAQAHGVRPSTWNSASGASGGVEPPQHADTIELDDSDEQMNGMLGSYREISIEDDEPNTNDDRVCDRSALLGEDTEEEVSNLSPDSGPVSPLEDDNELHEDYGDGEYEADRNESSKRPSSLQLAASCGARVRPTPVAAKKGSDLERKAHRFRENPQQMMSGPSAGAHTLQGLQGLVHREGDMVSFVVEDLQEQIKRASPVIRRGETPSFPGSRSSTPSLYKQALTPQLTMIDSVILSDVEIKARGIASSVDTILENLTGTLHSMSSLTVDCMETYHDSVCKTCDSVDGNIKAMYQLMAKFEELGNLMKPVYRMSGQVKEIKRLLDLLEQVATSGGS